MNYAGLLSDIFPAEGDGAVCPTCNLRPAVGLICDECAAEFRTIGDRLGARLQRRVQRQRRKAGA